MQDILRKAWNRLRDGFSSAVLGTTSPSVPRLDGGLSRPARFLIVAVALACALIAGAFGGSAWAAQFFYPALMLAGLFGGAWLALIAYGISLLVAARIFPVGDFPLFAATAAVQTALAFLLRMFFRESRRWGVRYRRLLSQTSAAVTVSDVQGRIERPHPELEGLIGMAWPSYAGTGWLKSVHPDDHGKFAPEGSSKDVQVHRAEIRLKDPATGDWRWHMMRAVPLHDENGEVVEWISTLTDVHERKLTGERQDMVIGEARHRLKNLMTIIDSLVKSSRPRDADAGVDAFQKRLAGRLHALSAASDLALAGNYTTMNARDVIAATLAPFLETESGRLSFGGPDVALAQATGGSLALAVHELATNAIKHGALSVPGGSVDFRWCVKSDGAAPRVEMVWREAGGPPPQKPDRQGFGTRVIQYAAARERGGLVTMEYPPEGYICRIGFDLPHAARLAAVAE